MGFLLDKTEFNEVLKELKKKYLFYAPVRKKGEGRYTDIDVVRYDFVNSYEEMELDAKSDYAFKEILTPLSQTLFFFTENEVKEADEDTRPVFVFLRSCDMHAVKRLDQIYLENGLEEDPFYRKIRDRLKFVLIACPKSFDDCFCIDMKSNHTEDGYSFSIDPDEANGQIRCDVPDDSVIEIFRKYGRETGAEEDTKPRYVKENKVHVTIPETVPNSIYKDPLWDEYSIRCINCGRCNFVCPTCTCYTMQDVYYTDNGKVGERRRVAASCMVDGYTNVAGGGQYRRTNGERMRFKVLHKIYDFRQRFDYDMCVGCGRCDMVCPEYISFSNCINKLNQAVTNGTAKNDKKIGVSGSNGEGGQK